MGYSFNQYKLIFFSLLTLTKAHSSDIVQLQLPFIWPHLVGMSFPFFYTDHVLFFPFINEVYFLQATNSHSKLKILSFNLQE